MRSSARAFAASLTAVLTFSSAAWAAPRSVLALEDPRGDDNGPGSYIYPSGSEYRPGDFDLRRFEVKVEGEDAIFLVTLGANVRRNILAQRGGAADLDLDNGLYVQNIDIYIDTKDGAGFTSGIPGRRIAFAPESAWDVALDLTPRPAPTRTILKNWNADAAKAVLTPGPIRSNGQTLSVRVPLYQLGGEPQKTWGYSVVVSGAAWDQDFEVIQRIARTHQSDAFTLPVYGVAEERAFGGGKLDSGNPYVIDVLLPAGVSQAKVLGTYSPTEPAVLPMVYPDPSRLDARAKAPPAASDAPRAETPVLAPKTLPSAAAQDAGVAWPLSIASIDGDNAVIPTPSGGVKQWQIGTVVDPQGRQKGKVVVSLVSNGFVVATITDGKNAIREGDEVRFGR